MCHDGSGGGGSKKPSYRRSMVPCSKVQRVEAGGNR